MNLPNVDADTTIVALASAAGGGLGVIRLSGPDALAIGRALFRSAPQPWVARHAYYGWWHSAPSSDAEALDEAVVTWFEAPHSYTGEHVLEVSVHGGALNLRRCLQACLGAGAVMAEPGEFTRRAYLNGRMDLTKAEAVADLIAAETDRALEQARSLLKGELYRTAMEARTAILRLRALVEVSLDFVEEDVPVIDPTGIAQDATSIAQNLRALAATYRQGRLWRDGARVVLAGAPNAGKSSLFNVLCGDERAIVTSIAGTTRDVIEERVDLLGVPVVLADTAGLRDASDEVEQIGVARAQERAASADLVLWVVDPTMAATTGDGRVELAQAAGVPTLKVWSKSDTWTTLDETRATVDPALPALAVSASTRDGIDGLIERVVEMLGGGSAVSKGSGGGLVIARERHKVAIEQAAEGLERASAMLLAGEPFEFAAVDIQEATDALSELVGLTTIEDVLDHLFSSFCIGK